MLKLCYMLFAFRHLLHGFVRLHASVYGGGPYNSGNYNGTSTGSGGGSTPPPAASSGATSAARNTSGITPEATTVPSGVEPQPTAFTNQLVPTDTTIASTSNPQAAQASKMWLYALVAAVGITLFIILIVRRRRKNQVPVQFIGGPQ